MSQQKKQWGAIIVMIALFAMIAFVTNLCTPMATIIKNQGNISNVLAQIGNYGNFIAYLVMGIPAGMLISKFGYKKTALIGLAIGIAGIVIQWLSGVIDGMGQSLGVVFTVYLIGAFIAGLCMCILNCVVNPMLNILGGGGNKGNQLIQLGGVFNSSAAVACYILMGALIADVTRSKIADVEIALMIALAIFVVAFIVICFTKIEEPEQAPVQLSLIKGAMSYRHFALGALGIFLYMGIEVGTPNFVQQYLLADTTEVRDQKASILEQFEEGNISDIQASLGLATVCATENMPEKALKEKADKEAVFLEFKSGAITLDEAATKLAKINDNDPKSPLTQEEIQSDAKKLVSELESSAKAISAKEVTSASISAAHTGRGIASATVGMIIAVYWFMMLIGRLAGASIGSKISARKMITTVSIATLCLVLFGMFAPETLVNFPGIDWGKLEFVMTPIPMGIFAFLLVGLCTSVMWGAIFNLAVEGLGKFTAIASGIFMTMVFGCAVMMFIQASVADAVGYINSYWVVVACAAYLLFYALVGSRVTKRADEEK